MSEIWYRDVDIGRKSKGVITVQRCLYGIAVCEVIFSKERVNEHLLVDPEFASLYIALKLNPKEVPERTQVLDAKSLLYIALDECEKHHRSATSHSIINMHCQQTMYFLSSPRTLEDEDGMIEL